MAILVYPHTIANGQVSSHTKLNENFTAIKTQVDNKLDGENIAPDAELSIATLEVKTRAETKTLGLSATTRIKLPSNDGSHSVYFKDHDGNTVMRVKSNGEVEIL